MVSRAPVYQMLWLPGFRAHTISGSGFNLFKPLRRHFRATPFCRQRRDASVQKIDDRLGGLRRGGDARTNENNDATLARNLSSGLELRNFRSANLLIKLLLSKIS
jgi:hypothetical protein